MSGSLFFVITPVFAVLIGAFFGWRGARDLPQSAPEFAVSAAWVLAWAAVWIFLMVVVMMMSINPEGMMVLMKSGAWFTVVSGALWVPLAMIAYVIHALRLRRA